MRWLAAVLVIGACGDGGRAIPDAPPCAIGAIVPNPIAYCICGTYSCLNGYYCGERQGQPTCWQNPPQDAPAPDAP